MSRPPSTGEYATAAMTNLQLYAVGVDSVAIVVSPDMTWFPTEPYHTTSCSTLRRHYSISKHRRNGTQRNNSHYSTHGVTSLHAQGISTAGVPAAALNRNNSTRSKRPNIRNLRLLQQLLCSTKRLQL